MTSLFKPDVPGPDPAVQKQQQDEQARAEAARISATQDQLSKETLIRSRSSGVRSLLGSLGGKFTSLLGAG